MIHKLTIFLLFTLLSLFTSFTLAADTTQNKAELAVANILFDYSTGDEEYASYRIDENGYAYVTFASNIPDSLYSKILIALQKHPDIRDIIPDKGGPRCQLW